MHSGRSYHSRRKGTWSLCEADEERGGVEERGWGEVLDHSLEPNNTCCAKDTGCDSTKS